MFGKVVDQGSRGPRTPHCTRLFTLFHRVRKSTFFSVSQLLLLASIIPFSCKIFSSFLNYKYNKYVTRQFEHCKLLSDCFLFAPK